MSNTTPSVRVQTDGFQIEIVDDLAQICRTVAGDIHNIGKTISEIVVVQHNATTGEVTVQDGFTNNYVGGPVAGTLKSMNATRALFSWSLPSLKDENNHWIPGITFSLNIIRATRQASITSNPQGNYKSARASGACSIQ